MIKPIDEMMEDVIEMTLLEPAVLVELDIDVVENLVVTQAQMVVQLVILLEPVDIIVPFALIAPSI